MALPRRSRAWLSAARLDASATAPPNEGEVQQPHIVRPHPLSAPCLRLCHRLPAARKSVCARYSKTTRNGGIVTTRATRSQQLRSETCDPCARMCYLCCRSFTRHIFPSTDVASTGSQACARGTLGPVRKFCVHSSHPRFGAVVANQDSARPRRPGRASGLWQRGHVCILWVGRVRVPQVSHIAAASSSARPNKATKGNIANDGQTPALRGTSRRA